MRKYRIFIRRGHHSHFDENKGQYVGELGLVKDVPKLVCWDGVQWREDTENFAKILLDAYNEYFEERRGK